MSLSQSLIWKPVDRHHTAVDRFMEKHGLDSYAALIQKSSHDTQWFWKHALEDLGLLWDEPYRELVDLSKGFPWAEWFVGGKLNIVKNCVDRHLENGLGDKAAFVWETDRGEHRELSYCRLANEIGQVANFLHSAGLKKGDRIGLYMPMIPEMVSVLFGAFKIGVAVVPVFSGFGPQALSVRLSDAACKMLFTADGSCRRGKTLALKPIVDEALRTAPSVKRVVVKRNIGGTDPFPVEMTNGRDLWWEDVIPQQSIVAKTESLDAEQPCLIIYTSGTTGKPKGTVHTHAGCLAQMSKELGYHFDLKQDDRFFWVTDIGWMMGPWEIIGVSFFGATFALFEGGPDFPEPDRLWKMIESNRITHLGISPTLIRLLKKAGEQWPKKYAMDSLRILGSTGEPWDPDSYQWFFEHVGKKRCPIMNISGGTEIVGCLLAPLPIHPLKPCTLQGPALGMDVDVWNEEGKPVRGEVGYLVCKQPAPSMTKGFLNDPDRYLETYFSKWPNVWNHGDWAIVDEDGYWFLQGRSDDTIKIAGKRTGPAEIESALQQHPAVAEAAAIGIPHEIKGEAVVCFVVLKGDKPKLKTVMPALSRHPEDWTPDQVRGDDRDLIQQLSDQVVAALGKTLRPEKIYPVPALPKTRSGKIVRGTIKRKYLGKDLGDLSSVDNPESLNAIPRYN